MSKKEYSHFHAPDKGGKLKQSITDIAESRGMKAGEVVKRCLNLAPFLDEVERTVNSKAEVSS